MNGYVTKVMREVLCGGALLAGTGVLPVGAQLAITEVMSETDTVLESGLEVKFKGPDYWELTNFGTNAMNLDGYCFSDSRQTNRLVYEPFTNLVIGPLESVVFFRVEPGAFVTNAAQFLEWWCDAPLPVDLQFRTYPSPGLDGDFGDELWVYDPQLNVVDAVRFGQARIGRSFAYDPENGLFGVFSIPGVNGAFRAELANDVGSPGTAAGYPFLHFVKHPEDQWVDAGATVAFAPIAHGLPRPKCQWFFNHMPLPGATGECLTLTNVQPADAGGYLVRIFNGLFAQTSLVATLEVNTNPVPPLILSPPVNLSVFAWQMARFTVGARGYPPPHYQWQSNGVDLVGETNATLVLPAVSQDMSGTGYTVQITNVLGATNTSAVLEVARRPCLRFTEVMAQPYYDDSSGHYDWFELTNCDTNAVNLEGYRFFDSPSFVGAHVLDDAIVLQPGESIIFVEQMSAQGFADWWGPGRLPPGLKVRTFHGFSLGDYGEVLYLWNAAATDPYDTVATVAWASVTTGVSLECLNYCDEFERYGCIGECLTDSVLGINGAVAAVNCGDLGSPGRTSQPLPRILTLTRDGPAVLLYCQVTPGNYYRVNCATNPASTHWTELGLYLAEDHLHWIEETVGLDARALFFRLEELP